MAIQLQAIRPTPIVPSAREEDPSSSGIDTKCETGGFEYWLKRGDQCAKEGTRKQAKKCYSLAIKKIKLLTKTTSFNEGILFEKLGKISKKLGEFQKAIVHYGEACAIAHCLGDQVREVRCFEALIKLYQLEGEDTSAIAAACRIVAIIKRSQDFWEKHRPEINSERLACHANRYKMSSYDLFELDDRICTLYKQQGDAKKEACISDGAMWSFQLGEIHARMVANKATRRKEWQIVIYYLKWALRFTFAREDERLVGQLSYQIGNAFLQINYFQEAIAYYNCAVESFHSKEDLSRERKALSKLGVVYLLTHKKDEWENCQKKMAKIGAMNVEDTDSIDIEKITSRPFEALHIINGLLRV